MSKSKTIALPCVLATEECEGLRKTLQGLLHVGGPNLVLNANAVERINSSGLQFLLAVAANCKQTQQNVQVEAPSAAVRAAIRDLSLADEFEPLMNMKEPTV